VFSKTANPLDLPQKSTIRALFKARTVDLQTYSPLSFLKAAQFENGSPRKISLYHRQYIKLRKEYFPFFSSVRDYQTWNYLCFLLSLDKIYTYLYTRSNLALTRLTSSVNSRNSSTQFMSQSTSSVMTTGPRKNSNRTRSSLLFVTQSNKKFVWRSRRTFLCKIEKFESRIFIKFATDSYLLNYFSYLFNSENRRYCATFLYAHYASTKSAYSNHMTGSVKEE